MECHGPVKHPVWLGAGLAAVNLIVHAVLPLESSVQIAALLLALIGAVYIGFAIVEGRIGPIFFESCGAALYFIAAFAGLVWCPLAIPVGIMAHAIWDFAHQNGAFGAPVPAWYIPFCAVIDLILGGGLFIYYWHAFQ